MPRRNSTSPHTVSHYSYFSSIRWGSLILLCHVPFSSHTHTHTHTHTFWGETVVRGETVVQEVEKSFSNQKVASSIPCRSVLEQDTEPLIAPDVQCAISVNVKCVYIVSR